MLPALLPAPISSSHLTASSYYVPYEYDNKTSKPETSIHITGSLAECGGHGEICSYKGYYLCQKKPEPRPFAFDLDIQEKTQYIVASEINRALTKYMDVLQQAINEKFKSYKGRFPICPQTNQPYLPFREMKIPLTPTQRNPPRIRAWNVYDTKSNDTKSNDTKSDTKNEPTLHPIKSNRFNKKCQVCKRKQSWCWRHQQRNWSFPCGGKPASHYDPKGYQAKRRPERASLPQPKMIHSPADRMMMFTEQQKRQLSKPSVTNTNKKQHHHYPIQQPKTKHHQSRYRGSFRQ